MLVAGGYVRFDIRLFNFWIEKYNLIHEKAALTLNITNKINMSESDVLFLENEYVTKRTWILSLLQLLLYNDYYFSGFETNYCLGQHNMSARLETPSLGHYNFVLKKYVKFSYNIVTTWENCGIF